MTIQELYNKINLQSEIVDCLETISKEIDMQILTPYLERMMKWETAAEAYQELCMVLNENSDRIKMLYCHLECACRIYLQYKEKNIPEKIFISIITTGKKVFC